MNGPLSYFKSREREVVRDRWNSTFFLYFAFLFFFPLFSCFFRGLIWQLFSLHWQSSPRKQAFFLLWSSQAALARAAIPTMLQMTNERFMLMALVEEYSPSPTIRLTDEDTRWLYIGLQWKVHVISSFEHLSFKTIFKFFHQKEVESHPKDGFHILCCTFTQTQKYINALFIIIYYSKSFVRVNHPWYLV